MEATVNVQFINKYVADIQLFFSNKDITFKCADGNVMANSEMLKLRSKDFKDMLEDENSTVYQTKMVDLPEIKMKSMSIFINFINTSSIKETFEAHSVGCDLLILAAKYDDQQLKPYMEKFLLNNISISGGDRIYEVLSMVNPKLLKEVCIKKLSLLKCGRCSVNWPNII